MDQDHTYQWGFGNTWSTEALPGALPVGRNSPQTPPFGLYAEQLSGSAFITTRECNRRSWLYRITPSAAAGRYEEFPHELWGTPTGGAAHPSPEALRWDAPPLPQGTTPFHRGITTWAGHGSPASGTGGSIHLYAANAGMGDTFLLNADGEWLLVPQEGGLTIHTELGTLAVTPGDIAVIPRGVRFQVDLQDRAARGYILENFGPLLRLPDLGPIGANGLANPRDFRYPVAGYRDEKGSYSIITKYEGGFWQTAAATHPLDVVAWHGNYAPYAYDLRRYNTIGSVSFDHPDPSIFTVLTSPGGQRDGYANIDFVIFPERWMVAEDTFRPPYYHRNLMSEYMGLIYGQYDAKPGGFNPGGGSLHNRMTGHGPDANAFSAASEQDLAPVKYRNTLAFMFESFAPWVPTHEAMASPLRQNHYPGCWEGLGRRFTPT